MPKGFKILISEIISSFQFCRSKNSSNFPENPVPSFLQLSPNPVFIDYLLATSPPFKPHHSSFKHHVSSIFSSVGCGFSTYSTTTYYPLVAFAMRRLVPLEFRFKLRYHGSPKGVMVVRLLAKMQSSIPSTSNAFDVLESYDMDELGNGDSSQELRNRGSPSPSDPNYGETSKEDNRRKLKAKLHDLKNARRKF
ncbi:uncharacterized protein LOC114309315 [Camellia sinensis]|uniref:uncharacterized protein LOC114309315 n=1 Tax=Camellia sinensis TaxID=4442 RepID=UPI001035CFCD|nr:uncharacterized protein LOC114309315 [Camellia sinensis]